MATVEIELRKYVKRKTKIVDGQKVVTLKTDGLMPLVLRITSGSHVSRKNTGLYIKAAEWDEAKRRVNRRHPEWARLNNALDVLCKEAEAVKADLISARQPVTGAVVLSRVFATQDFYAAAAKVRDSFSSEQTGTKNNYDAMISRLKAYRPTLLVEEITPAFLAAFRTHLSTKGQTDAKGNPKGYAYNTVVETLAKVKSVLSSLDLKGENPFKRVPVGNFHAANAEAPGLDDILKLRRYLPTSPEERLALDAFLFSFYAAGMRSGDVLQLPWSAIKGDRIVYDQRKKRHTEKSRLSIPLNAVTTEILSRYDRSTATVFNCLERFGGSKPALIERQKMQKRINITLRTIAKRCGVETRITYRLARTAFSRIANEISGRNVYGIQQAMGHTNVKTTEIYLGSDTRAVDELLQVVYG